MSDNGVFIQELFELKLDGGACTAFSVGRFDTFDKATMNCDACKLDSTFLIAAGQDECCQLYTLISRIQAHRPHSHRAYLINQ